MMYGTQQNASHIVYSVKVITMEDKGITEKYNGNNTGLWNRYAIVQVQTKLFGDCINLVTV